MYSQVLLDNKLRVITHYMPAKESAGIGLWVTTGCRYEDEVTNGIAHFFEHLVFKGSERFSCNQIKESIEGVGGTLNGFTSEELTCYYVKVPSKFTELSLRVLSDMVLNPLLKRQDIEKERSVILEEIRMYKDLPERYVLDLLDSLLWPGHPLGMNIAGTLESIRAIRLEQFLQFKERFYQPARILIVACGNIHTKSVADLARRLFSSSQPNHGEDFLPVREDMCQPRWKLQHKPIEQTHLAIGFRALPREHPQRYALSILHVILGANMSSRLFSEVREKRGLAYAIGTHVKRLMDTGSFVIQAGVDNKRSPQALEVILGQLRRICREAIKPDELKRAKEYCIGQLRLGLEDTLESMLWLGEPLATLGWAPSPEEVIKKINRVNQDDVRLLARQILRRSNLRLAAVGPVSKTQTSQLMKIGGDFQD